MTIEQIEKNLEILLKHLSQEEFIFDLLLAYGTPKATVTLLKKGRYNLLKKDGNITLKRKIFFQELLERVRSIRTSERRIYLQITDIFKECSIDYDSNSQITKDFYASVQNKFHFAITGQTAAEIVYTKANKDKTFMGLSTWKN